MNDADKDRIEGAGKISKY